MHQTEINILMGFGMGTGPFRAMEPTGIYLNKNRVWSSIARYLIWKVVIGVMCSTSVQAFEIARWYNVMVHVGFSKSWCDLVGQQCILGKSASHTFQMQKEEKPGWGGVRGGGWRAVAGVGAGGG